MPLPRLTLATAVPEPAALAGGVLALPLLPGGTAPAWSTAVTAAGLGLDPDAVAAQLVVEKACGRVGEIISVPLAGTGPTTLLLYGTGASDEAAPTHVGLRRSGAALARRAKGSPSLRVVLPTDAAPAAAAALGEGALLASYTFSLQSEPAERTLAEVVLHASRPAAALTEAVSRAAAVAAAVEVARDLVNTPSMEKTPAWLATRAKGLSRRGVTVSVRDEKALAAEGFGGLVGVGQGSTRPPRLVEMSYAPDGAKAHVVLVGKGITFDTGGLSLKKNDGMMTMKNDMSGAAAVVGVLHAVAELGIKVRVTGLLAAAENMPSGTAIRPGDVLTQFGGTTVEVLNTDAEGRLVLADALAYAAAELAPDLVVDIATLTGAMPVALGRLTAGVFATSDSLAEGLAAAAETSGEKVWRMPIVEEYRDALDSEIADLRNNANPEKEYFGGSIIAALFLREFTAGLPWAHVDIAGTARTEADDHELTRGGTGYGVRLLLTWLESLGAAGRARR